MGHCKNLGQRNILGQSFWGQCKNMGQQKIWVIAIIWVSKKLRVKKIGLKKHFKSMQKFVQQRYTRQKNILVQCKNLRQQKIKDLKL